MPRCSSSSTGLSVIALCHSQLRLSPYRRLRQPTPSAAARIGPVRSALQSRPKPDFDMGLKDSQFNDWNTLSVFVFCGLSRASLARLQVSILRKMPDVYEITSYCILIISIPCRNSRQLTVV